MNSAATVTQDEGAKIRNDIVVQQGEAENFCSQEKSKKLSSENININASAVENEVVKLTESLQRLTSNNQNGDIPSIQITSADDCQSENKVLSPVSHQSSSSKPSSCSQISEPKEAIKHSPKYPSSAIKETSGSPIKKKKLSDGSPLEKPNQQDSHPDKDPSTSSSTLSLQDELDGGWGWMIVLASFVAHLIADGCGFSFGVLFSELLDVFGETKGITAWVGSLFVSIPAICGPIASAMTNRFGCRTTTILGGLISVVGCLLSANASSIGELCITFGLISGFGLSLVYVPSTIIVAFYFEKRRAFATGVAVAGSGIGTMIFAPLVELLIDYYQWRGTFYVIAGILLNIVVCGALFRPLRSLPIYAVPVVTSSNLSSSISNSHFANRSKPVVASLRISSVNNLETSASLPVLYDSKLPADTEYSVRRDSVGKRPHSNQRRFPQSLSACDSALNNFNSTIIEESEESGGQTISTEKLISPAENEEIRKRAYTTNDKINGLPCIYRNNYQRNLSQSFPEFSMQTHLDSNNKLSHSMTKIKDPMTISSFSCRICSSDQLNSCDSLQSTTERHSKLDRNGDSGLESMNEIGNRKEMYSSNNNLNYEKAENTLNALNNDDESSKFLLSNQTLEEKHVKTTEIRIPNKPNPLTLSSNNRNVFQFPTNSRHVTDRGPIFLSRGDMSHRGSLLTANFFLSKEPPCRSASCPEISVQQEVEQESWHHGCKILKKVPCITKSALKSAVRALDLSVFRSPVFILFCLHTVLLYISYDIPYVYGPVRAMSMGISDSKASFLVSIIGLFSTIGQVLMGYLGDQSYISVLPFYNAMTTVSGVATILMPCAAAYFWLGTLCAAYGFFISANFALTTVILIDLIGIERLTNAYGIVSLAQGAANLFGPPIAGWLSDVTSSYNAAFYSSGAIICASGLMLFFAPILARRERSKLELPETVEAA